MEAGIFSSPMNAFEHYILEVVLYQFEKYELLIR